MTVPARQAYDLILKSDTAAPIGLMLYRGEPNKRLPAVTLSRYGPANEDETSVIRDVGVTQADFSGGFGYSQRWDVPNTYAWGEGVCTRWPRVVIPAGRVTDAASFASAGHIVASRAFLGNIYWVTDTGKVYKSAGGTGTPGLLSTLTTTFPTGMEVFLNNMYVGGVPGSQAMWRLDSTENWTQLIGINYGHPAVTYSVTADNVGALRLLGSASWSSVAYTSGDPSVAGNWGSAIGIGGAEVDVKAITASNRHWWVIKLDGVYDVNELGEASNLTPYYREVQDGTARIFATVHEAYLYVGQGKRGLDRIDLGQGSLRRDMPEWCQPGYGIPNETPILGYVTALSVDSGWLVCAITNPTNGNSYLMYGQDRRYANIPGPGPILWHGAEAVILKSGGVNAQITDIRIATPSTGNPILWLAAERGSTINFYKVSLPKTSSPLSDVLFGGAHEFNTDASLYLTAQDWGQEWSLAKKQIRMYDVRGDNLGTGGGTRSIQLYSNAEGGAYSLEGTMTASGRASFGPTTLEGYNIGLRAQLTSLTNSAAIFRGVRMRAAVLAEQDLYTPYEVEFGPGVPLMPGYGEDNRSAIEVKNALIALQDSAPFTMVDEFGQTHSVRMAQQMEFSGHESSEYGSWRIRAKFLIRVLS